MPFIIYPIISLVAYLLGAIPSSYLVVKTFTGKNVMEHGTGNVGTMNTHRATNNKLLTILVLIMDLSKGALSFYAAFYAVQEFGVDYFWGVLLAGFFNVLGHNYSVFLKFKGGKGLATAAGFFLLVNYWAVVAWVVVFLATVLVSRYMVLGQITGTVIAPFVLLFLNVTDFWIVVPACALIFIKHFPRLQDVISGKEPKMYYKEKGQKGV